MQLDRPLDCLPSSTRRGRSSAAARRGSRSSTSSASGGSAGSRSRVDRARADPAARRPRSSSSAASRCSRGSKRRACSTSARARARSRSRSPTSIRARAVTGIDVSARRARARRARTPRAPASTSSSLVHDLFEGLPAGPWDARGLEPAVRRPRATGASLQPEVRDWEPDDGALRTGGQPPPSRGGAVDGLADGGALVLEVGDGQAQETAALLRSLGLRGRPDDTRSRRPRPGRSRGAGERRRRRRSQRSGRAGSRSSRRTPSTGSRPTAPARTPRGRSTPRRGGAPIQPTALLFASVDELDERLPELPAQRGRRRRALLPGPLTLVVPNPRSPIRMAQRSAAPTRSASVSLPSPAPAATVLAALGVLVATSANLPGGPDPRRRRGRARRRSGTSPARSSTAASCPGRPSTVVDLDRAAEPGVLREGAVPAE